MLKQIQFFRILLPLIIAVGVAVSTAILYSQSIRLDESQSIWVSTKPIATIIKITAQDVQVPLYPVLLHFWMQIFGTSILAARSLSFLFFFLTIPVLYSLGKLVANKHVGMLTIAFFALSPFVLWYSNEARTYTLFTFVTSMSHYFFIQMITTNGKKGRTGYFVATILGILSHYFFLFLLLTQACFVFWIYLRDVFAASQEGKPLYTRLLEYRRLLASFLTVIFFDLLLFLPWVIYFFALGAATNTQPLIPPPTSYNLFQTFITFLFGFQSQALQSTLVALWPLTILLLFFVFTQRRRIPALGIDYFFLATFLPIMMVFVASYVRPIFLSRYLILTTPSLFLLLAWLLLNYPKRIASYLITIILAGMFCLLVLQNISTQTPVKENYAEVASYLQQHATTSDIIVITPPFTIYPIEYTYAGTVRLDTMPTWDRYSQGAIPPFSLQVMQQQLASYQKQYRKMFFVFSYDQGYQNTIVHYLDTHYQMLDNKTFSPGLFVRVYQLRYD